MRSVLGQHIFIGLSGKSLTESEKKFIVENNIGGVTLFGRNYESPEQIRSLCAEIQSLRHKMKDRVPLFIGIDMEGGRVHRLKAPFTQWPPLKKLGDLDSPSASFSFAYCMGQELRAVGINLDYAPCIDVLTNSQNTVIGDRALSSNPELVAKHSSALIRGYMKADVVPCAKHFPGHGDTLIDSHDDLPVQDADRNRLDQVELIPFKKALKSRLQLLMTAHIRFPKIDPDWPVTLSEIFIKKLIREEFRYRGFIISDDLGMKALSAHYPAELIPVRALQVGIDILLYCNEPETPPIALDALEKAVKNSQLSADQVTTSYKKILEWKKQTLTNPDPLDAKAAANIIGHADHYKLSQAIANGEVPSGLISIE
jgi:beta-N-acetylhexosaminidase